MKAYKLVQYEGGRLVSYAAHDRAKVEYFPHEPSEAPAEMAEHGYYPLAFDTLENLEMNSCRDPHEQVWECECEEEVPLPIRLNICIMDWKGIERALEYGETGEWPTGTRMFKKITLTERIE